MGFPAGAMGVEIRRGKNEPGTFRVYAVKPGSRVEYRLIPPGKEFGSITGAYRFARRMAEEIAQARQIPIPLRVENTARGHNTWQIQPPYPEPTKPDGSRFTVNMSRFAGLLED